MSPHPFWLKSRHSCAVVSVPSSVFTVRARFGERTKQHQHLQTGTSSSLDVHWPIPDYTGYQPYSSLATSSYMGGCPSRITGLAYQPLWGLSGVRPGFRARSRWKWAIRAVVRRIKLRRLIAIAFQNLAGESHLFDHLARQQGRLERRTAAPSLEQPPSES